MKPFFFISLLFLVLTPALGNAISKYVDENGRTVFVDDESKIPARYLEQSESIQGLRELTPEQKKAQASRLRQAREDRKAEIALKRYESSLQEREKLYQTPVIINGPQVLVPVEVAYKNRNVKLNLLLDTGASHTVLHSQSLSRLDVDLEEGTVSYGVGVGGYRIKTWLMEFRSIKVGPFKADRASALVIKHRNSRALHDGLLGMDFLRHFSYEIDYAAQTIQWQP